MYIGCCWLLALVACQPEERARVEMPPLPDSTRIVWQQQTEYLSGLILTSPKDGRLYMQRAHVYLQAQDYRNALSDAEEAIKLSGSTAETLYLKALALRGLRRPKEAFLELMEARNHGLSEAELLAVAGDLAYKSGFVAQAEMYLQEAVRLYGTMHEPVYYLGMMYRDRGDTTQAFQYWRRAVSLRPDFTPAYEAAIGLYNRLNQPANAIPWMTAAALHCPPDAGFYQEIGNLYLRLGQQDTAARWYSRAFRIDSTRWESAYQLAQHHISQKNFIAAEGFYTAALRLNPDIPNGYYQLGYIYEYYLAQYEKAQKSFVLAGRMDTTNRDIPRSIRRVEYKMYLTRLAGQLPDSLSLAVPRMPGSRLSESSSAIVRPATAAADTRPAGLRTDDGTARPRRPRKPVVLPKRDTSFIMPRRQLVLPIDSLRIGPK